MKFLQNLPAALRVGVRVGLISGLALAAVGDALPWEKAGLWLGAKQSYAADLVSDPESDSFDWSPYQALDQEQIYYAQRDLMDYVIANLKSERSGVTDLYFVGFGGHAYQDVFMKEVMSVRALFDTRFDTQSRSIALVNNLKTVNFLPLANQHNLATALEAVAERMDVEVDVLFLFLTSHGSRDHQLSTEFWPFGLNDLSAERLDEMLDASGIKWRVVVVSACFSGGFIEPLQDEHSLILTASRADRNSFGCSHLNDFTNFGQAFFDEQLRAETSFTTAFHGAADSIAAREQKEGLTPSEPQIFLGEAMAGKLAELDGRPERRPGGRPGGQLEARAELHSELPAR